MITYSPLWHTLLDRGLKKMDLCRAADISSSTLAKLGKNEYVALDVVERICLALACPIEQVIKIEKTPK